MAWHLKQEIPQKKCYFVVIYAIFSVVFSVFLLRHFHFMHES